MKTYQFSPLSSNYHNKKALELVLENALAGEVLSIQDCYKLFEAPDDMINLICEVACEMRNRSKGNVVSYSRKVFIPLTTLCRDSCGYCTFAKSPGDPAAKTLWPEEVLKIAIAGEKSGCKEALFSLGERPEMVHSIARKHLKQLGYKSMLDYLYEMCNLILRETTLIPHVNPGSLSLSEIQLLRSVSPTMGMMLENSSVRLTEPGQPHFGCPDKHPVVRLNTLKFAGASCVPFTTGILIGIGETSFEIVESLLDIRRIHSEYGHIQEVIVQNFRAKTGTRMHGLPEPDINQMQKVLAISRIILGSDMNLQAPPNLMPNEYGIYLKSGINDWGGISPVTPDHINPEASWPNLCDVQSISAAMGHVLRERLSIYPDYLNRRDVWLDTRFHNRWCDNIDSDGYVKEEEYVL
tara:strand:+ start:365 stop:1591 length:1227 start_codon:yes stop_codon:yes gene_type:complete